MTPEEQIHSLRQMASDGLIKWLFRSAIGLSVLCFVCGVKTNLPPYYMFAIFLGLLAFATYQTAPHIRRAALALDSSNRTTARIEIAIDSWSDSQSFHAIVPVSPTLAWKFEFIPQGWKPSAGTVEAELCFIPGVEWPTLLITKEGIIHPRYEPKPQCTSQRHD
jgi:hypothetical protein